MPRKSRKTIALVIAALVHHVVFKSLQQIQGSTDAVMAGGQQFKRRFDAHRRRMVPRERYANGLARHAHPRYPIWTGRPSRSNGM